MKRIIIISSITLILAIIFYVLFIFSTFAYAQEERNIDHQIEILELKLEIVRLKKGIWLERVKQAVYFSELRIEENRLDGEINNLKILKADRKKKQEANKKAEEGKE